jgi:hypothetical protein
VGGRVQAAPSRVEPGRGSGLRDSRAARRRDRARAPDRESRLLLLGGDPRPGTAGQGRPDP